MTAAFDTLLADARARLHGVPQELLGAWVTPRRILGLTRQARIVSVGSAWRVGALLIGDDTLAAVGEVIRSADPGRRGYTAESARERADVRAAALRGGIPSGVSVHVGWVPIDEDAVTGASGPIRVIDGVPQIRWSRAGGLMPLEAYLRERIDLMLGV